jgi:hypothetical protein
LTRVGIAAIDVAVVGMVGRWERHASDAACMFGDPQARIVTSARQMSEFAQ